MNSIMWVRQFCIAFVVAGALIAGAQMLKGNALDYSLLQGAIWGAIAAAVFTLLRVRQSRKGIHCAVCGDVAGDDAVGAGNEPGARADSSSMQNRFTQYPSRGAMPHEPKDSR
ncbi:MAG: hypothetical protein ABI440_08830 [Casimicrobiaceae bacterium]